MSAGGRGGGTPPPFRFGVVCGAADARRWSDQARRVEALGYSVLLSSDHLDLSGSHFSMLSAVPALAAAAAATTTLRLGASVFNHDLRHPAVLAREAVTLDILSDGRFEVGLGAGHAEYEYAWAGIPFDPVGRRIERFQEYVEIVRRLTSGSSGADPSVTFSGKHFGITGMPVMPAPVQSRVPIMIGGTGRRMLRIAARLADVVNVNLNGPVAGTAEAMDQRMEWIRAAAAGRDKQPGISNILGTVVVSKGSRREALRSELVRQRAAGSTMAAMNEEVLLASPIALIGSIESIVEEVVAWRERWGISYVIVTYPVLETFAPVVDRLAGR